MKRENTLRYYAFVREGIDLFLQILENDFKIPIFEIESTKNKYSSDKFQTYYDDFYQELISNILEYKDEKIIFYYIKDSFGSFDWKSFEHNLIGEIIKKEYETSFMLILKKSLDLHKSKISSLITDKPLDYNLSEALQQIYFKTLYKHDEEFKAESNEVGSYKYSLQVKFNDQFSFNKLKEECSLLSNNEDKIKLIYDRVIEYRQWQLEYDEFVQIEGGGSYRPITASMYSKFETFCDLEIKRLYKHKEINDEISKTKSTISQMINNKNFNFYAYKWNSTDTDLLELVTALYKTGVFVRRDGKKLDRKQLTDFFQELLGMDIKDLDGKLTKAGNRNDKTPFLEKLAQEFRNYVAEKEKKLVSRR